MNGYLQSLQQSSLTPPRIVFRIVWPVLYGLLFLSAFVRYRATLSVTNLLWPFGAQLVLNALWVFVFFRLHRPNIAFGIILVIGANLMYSVWTLEPRLSAYLLVPKLVWILLATYLNGYVWRNNPVR
jgi:benzodiazapine receptor